MHYAATIQSHPEKPPLLIGVGETHPEALGAARIWFQKEFDRTSSKDWGRLTALQEQLTISTEEEFASRTGVGLDEWLARMAAAGVAPAKAPKEPEPYRPLVPPSPRSGAGGDQKFVYVALFFVLFSGSFATVRYLSGRLVNHTIETAISNSNTGINTGPAFEPAIATFDPDGLWGGDYELPDDSDIDTVAGP